MKRYRYVAASLVFFLTICVALLASEATAFDMARLMNHPSKTAVPETASFEVAFSPSPESEAAIVRFIGEARASVHVAAYSFTSKEIAGALVQAARKGLDVRVVVDKSQLGEKYTAAIYLANQNVPVRVDSMYAIQHQKVITVDSRSVELGSFNFTASARDRNSECVLVVREVPELAARFEQNWAKMWQESQPLAPRH
ncbi:MAG: phospholipase D family protein [Thermodesulfovibrionales bacterium]